MTSKESERPGSSRRFEAEVLFLSFLPPDYWPKNNWAEQDEVKMISDVEYNRVCPAKEEHIRGALLKVRF